MDDSAAQFFDESELEGSNVRDAIPNRLGKVSSNFFAEYGIREDDGVFIMHIYASPKHAEHYLRGGDTTCYEDWARGFHSVLDRALAATFGDDPPSDVLEATYMTDIRSYCLVSRRLGASPDPWPRIDKLFTEIGDA